MIRVLLVLLAVLIAVLAFVLDRPLLYAAAGVSLATALVMVGRRLWTAYRSHRRRDKPESAGQSSGRSESLEDLGIMEVRPQSKKEGGEPAGDQSGAQEKTSREETPHEGASRDEASQAETAHEEDGSREARSDETLSEEGSDETYADADHPAVSPPSDANRDGRSERRVSATSESDTPSDDTPSDETSSDDAPEPAVNGDATTGDAATSNTTADASRREGVVTTPVSEEPVLAPYVEAVRAALGARTVCVLVQEDVALDYDIRAIASAEPHVRRSGSFSTQEPLLTAAMTQQSVTIRPLDGEGAVGEFLCYYETDVDVDHVALAPIRRPNEPATYFLLADAASDTDLGATRSRNLLQNFAETLALVLESEDPGAVASSIDLTGDVGSNGGQPTTTASEAAAAERAHAADQDDTSPRPRSEIIAEEMAAADEESEPLALVLIHLNRAESLADEGPDAVTAAEKKLRTRLEDAAPGSRVTRFGELTYGVFFRGAVESVEPWAADLQRELDEETGMLEGGVSIGVAMRGTRHDGRPESFRTDATQALREAYESGAATIIE